MSIHQKLNRFSTALALMAVVTPPAIAQHFDMLQWGEDRGYVDAPYYRYEAEPGLCVGFSGEYLEQSDDQLLLQSEASNQQAVTLGRDGYVEWRNDSGDADGLTLRFSVPWGTEAKVGIFAGNGEELGKLSLNAEHSWEYCEKRQGNRHNKPEIYSIHVKNDDEFVRMRFDETHTRLSRGIAEGESFSIRNLSDIPVTVDFVEIEKTRKVDYKDGWIRWDKSKGSLQDFINANQGHTIYIDEEYVDLGDRLNLGSSNLQGRGIWYTELHWSRGTAGFNGFDGSLKDVYLSSYQNQRYNSSDHSPNGYQSPGKCFNGSAGNVENVWVEHFECGGWLDGANGSKFSHCRFRNNYADGMNFCNSSNCVVENSNFRNNGDDDMASWSAQAYCSNNTYRYCTAEHNWRASSLGFFGGGGHKAHNILIKDGLESGARLVSDFSGPAFGNEGIKFNNITIVHCACIDGPVGQHGDFWGVNEAALHVESSTFYSIENPVFENIDIIDSRGNAIFIGSGSHSINNLKLKNLSVDGVRDPQSYAVYFEDAKGFGSISDIVIDGVDDSHITNINNGNLESGSAGDFRLEVEGVSSKPVTLVPGCELGLSGLAWERADRSVDLRDGDRVIFSTRVVNNSEVDLPDGYSIPVVLSFDNGSSVSFPALKEPLNSGASKVISTTWTAVTGGHTVTAILDPMNRYDYMTPAGNGSVTKKINVHETDIDDLTFDRTSGVDFQPLDLRWKVQGDADFGKGSIQEGDRLVLAGVVANTGNVDSPGDSKLGVFISPSGKGWSADDTDIRWCDKNEAYQPLAAGSVNYFPATGGNATSDGIWIARKGTYNILIHANDHANESGNRREDNTTNNIRYFSLTVPYDAKPLHLTPDSPDDLSVQTGSTMLPVIPADAGIVYDLSGLPVIDDSARRGILIINGKIVNR